LFAVLVCALTAFSRTSACCSDSIELIATDVTDALAVEVVGDNTEVVVETIGANGSRGLNAVVVVARIVVVVVRLTTVVVVAVRLTTVVVVVLRGTVVTLRTVVAVVGATVVVVVGATVVDVVGATVVDVVGATVVDVVGATVVDVVGATVVNVVVVVVVPGSGDPPDDGAGTLFVTEVAANVAASLPAESCNAFVSLLPVGSV
jgi:AAHS family 4-hydroxybenzoate transporter-like MFS transporter